MPVPSKRGEKSPYAVERSKSFATIFDCKSTFPEAYFLLGSSVVGIQTHYTEEGPRPCNGEKCLYCSEGRQQRFKGYISAFSVKRGNVGILCLTEYATGQILSMYSATESLRGSAITLQRATPKKNAKVIVNVFDQPFPAALPSGIDPIAILIRLWRVNLSYVTYLPGCKFDPNGFFVSSETTIAARVEKKKGGNNARR